MTGRGVILVVDDDPDIRDALREVFLAEGFSVADARHGAEALDWLRTHDGAIGILLDLMMPVLDGWAFRAEQLADPRLASIPVIVLSAHASRGDVAQLGAAAFLSKPVDLDALLLAVGQHFQRSTPTTG